MTYSFMVSVTPKLEQGPIETRDAIEGALFALKDFQIELGQPEEIARLIRKDWKL